MYTTKAVAKRKPEKTFWLERDSNPQPMRYQCSGLLPSYEVNSELVTLSEFVIHAYPQKMKT